MKHIILYVSGIFMLLFILNIAPEKYVQAKNLKSKVKTTSNVGFVGDFYDATGEIKLSISKKGKKYKASYEQFRLCTMDNLKGTVKKGILTLKGLDPAGELITITVSKKGNKRVLTFKKTSWEYFTQGSIVKLNTVKCRVE